MIDVSVIGVLGRQGDKSKHLTPRLGCLGWVFGWNSRGNVVESVEALF